VVIADRLIDLVREGGPLTVAAFMQLALYDAELGYYARAPQRSGRAGDFFTSVDVGPLFGELLEIQVAEMAALLAAQLDGPHSGPDARQFDLVEAGAGNGRLSADILRAARRRHPALHSTIALHLVEASESARAAQVSVLSSEAERLMSSGAELPRSFDGVLIANELLDAMPVHQMVMRGEDLREVYVTCEPPSARGRAAWRTIEGPPSTPRLTEYLQLAGVTLESGWRVEISLSAVDWIREAARRLGRGFIIIIDYGHEARELYSVSHAGGTLTTFAHHHSDGPEAVSNSEREATAPHAPRWLTHAGDVDMTAHVDFTSIRGAAECEGLDTLGFLDQTYFLLGLWGDGESFVERNDFRRLTHALKTLVMPGGMGSSHKVLILGKNVGRPTLRGCAFRVRVT
jgi:SAM-dependent MidA family methyltransferase